ncbi:hypothetical protein VNO77_10008 [Canavalia gladiata]|uniref:Uncharacterized protein n=1 Tax=Canavalia gladiata TaxID=3824 RepID=A0AAN9M9W2_CANGL
MGTKRNLIDDVDHVGQLFKVSRYFQKGGYFLEPLDEKAVKEQPGKILMLCCDSGVGIDSVGIWVRW